MRVKKDYMGNDQLLPAYNLQMVVCDEYIVSVKCSGGLKVTRENERIPPYRT